MKPCYLLGFDIETGGPRAPMFHPLLAVGFCLYRWNGLDLVGLELVDTLEVHIKAELEYEPDTLQFWLKNPQAWEYIKTNTVPQARAAQDMIAFLKKYQKLALDEGLPFRFVTDNSWFDDTILSAFLVQHGGNMLRYNYYTGFSWLECMIDINQHIHAFTVYMGGVLLPFKPSVPHDHTPVHDSMGIVEKYVNYTMSTSAARAMKK